LIAMWAIVANLVALSFMMYIIQKVGEIEGKEGFMYSVYPWINTFPETLTTALLLIGGYPTAALYNSVMSATFDAALGIGLTAVIHGTVAFTLTDLALFTAVAGVAFMFLDFDGLVSPTDAAALYAILALVTAYSIARYGFFKRRISAGEAVRTLLSLLALGVVTYVFYINVEALIPLLGERISGVIAAVLTSVPDLVTAAVYGVTSPESQAELLGCIAHDFVENVPTAVLAATLVAGSQGMVDAAPLRTLAITGITLVALLFVASFRRVTRFEGLVLAAAFIAVVLIDVA